MRVLITGLCGFIGHHVANHLLNHTDWEIVGLDRIDATSTLHRLRYIDNWEKHRSRVKFVWHDLRAPVNASVDREIDDVSCVFHLAASTHIDRSIKEPLGFVMDNVVGSAHLLDWWRQLDHRASDLFVQFGTDEIFGPAPVGFAYKEWDRYKSTNPYSASKAGAEELACAFSNTYRIRVAATHTMNVFGERQHAEKFVPLVIRKLLEGEEVFIHSDEAGTGSGSRFYLHAENVGRVLRWLADTRTEHLVFDKWNLVGEREVTNLEMATMISEIVGRPLKYRIVNHHATRPGHDPRYALDGDKLKAAGFDYPENLEQSLERTVKWFLDHPEWLQE